MSRAPTCPYCRAKSKLVSGKVVYPHRADLGHKKFYLCAPCNAYVGCHERPDASRNFVALGTLADAALRAARLRAHTAFDPLWRNGGMTRAEAYAWLRVQLNIPKDRAHIAMFDEDQCATTVAAVMCREVE